MATPGGKRAKPELNSAGSWFGRLRGGGVAFQRYEPGVQPATAYARRLPKTPSPNIDLLCLPS
jgi:hypothetical protein